MSHQEVGLSWSYREFMVLRTVVSRFVRNQSASTTFLFSKSFSMLSSFHHISVADRVPGLTLLLLDGRAAVDDAICLVDGQSLLVFCGELQWCAFENK